MKNLIICIGSAALLAGCTSMKIRGNDFGGVVNEGGMHPDKAYSLAQQHCAQYGKQAHITSVTVRPQGTDPVLFDCVR